jgi:light-independent protochlorophyllide reductase subunit B
VEGHAPRAAANDLEPTSAPETGVTWDSAAEKELKKIPFFVRGKARRNTERFAIERGVDSISLETLYEAKAHFGR